MSIQNSKAFRELVEAFVDEAQVHGCDVSHEAARQILGRRVEGAARLLWIQEESVLRTYLTEGDVRAMARELVAVAAAEGATGRDDEPAVTVPRSIVGRLVADLGQAGRFAASHGHLIPESGVHNVVADACVIVGLALTTSTAERVDVPGYGLRLARRAMGLVAEGTKSGWVLALAEPEAPETLASMTQGVLARMQEMNGILTDLLPELPPPRIHEGT